MGRVINTNEPGKNRTQLIRGIVLALRELMQQKTTDASTKDIAAFIGLSLEAISQTVDQSVAAWEKRGYWLKADKFRMEWQWSEALGKKMRTALLNEDWPAIALAAAQITEKVKSVSLPQRHRLGKPWVGAWEKFVS